MKLDVVLISLLAVLSDAYTPIGSPNTKSFHDLKKSAMGAFTAISLASNIATTLPASAISMDTPPVSLILLGDGSSTRSTGSTMLGSSSSLVAAKIVREGMYREYEVDLPDTQVLDNAESTFKSAKETKSKKGKYTALLAILVVGSFIIPMAQYFWYVRDDDSTDRFFDNKKATPAPEPPKKKGFFDNKKATPAPEPPKKKGWF